MNTERSSEQIQRQIEILTKKLGSIKTGDYSFFPLRGKIKKLREELKTAFEREHLGR